MDKLAEHDSIKLGGIFHNVIMKKKKELDSLNGLTTNLEILMVNLQKKYITHLSKKCVKEYEWIEQNTHPSQKEGFITYEVREDVKPFAALRMKDWENCTKSHDHGISSYFNSLYKEQKEYSKENENCLNTCINDLHRESEEVVYSCFEGCIDNVISKTKKFISINEKKLGEYERRLN